MIVRSICWSVLPGVSWNYLLKLHQWIEEGWGELLPPCAVQPLTGNTLIIPARHDLSLKNKNIIFKKKKCTLVPFFLNCSRLHQFSDSLQWILPKYFLSRFLDAARNDCFILLKSKAKQKRGNIPHSYKFNFLSFKWSLCLLWLGNTIFIQTSHSSSLQGSAPWPFKFMADIKYCWKEKHLWLLLFSSGSSEWWRKQELLLTQHLTVKFCLLLEQHEIKGSFPKGRNSQ